jgi:hypothetical protein
MKPKCDRYNLFTFGGETLKIALAQVLPCATKYPARSIPVSYNQKAHPQKQY